MASLITERNALHQVIEQRSRDIETLAVDRAQLTAEIVELRTQLDQAQALLAAHRHKLESGQVVEFEYAYRPSVRNWDLIPGGNPYFRLCSTRDSVIEAHVRSFLRFRKHLAAIPVDQPATNYDPFWNNGWLPIFDAVAIYGLIALRKPRTYFEVGSGNSTKFARRAIEDHGLQTRIVSIDPGPRAEIDQLCDEVIRLPLEDVGLDRFTALGKGDILFVDNSHRAFQNSDVTVFFTEILPLLGDGCLYGLHDIPLPVDYSPDWQKRYYNEQYMLMAYLIGGAAGDQIELPMGYVSGAKRFAAILDPIAGAPAACGADPWGSSFWMLRRPASCRHGNQTLESDAFG